MKILWILLFALPLASCAVAVRNAERAPSSDSLLWQENRGISVSNVENSLIIVRADPKVTPLELVNPPETNSLSVANVAGARGFSVMINAAMFAQDYVTSIGYMRNFGNINNPRISQKMRGFLMFNPKRPSLPSVKIGSAEGIADYNTVFQTHRMWSAAEGILWKKGASVYHHVGLVGVDSRSRVLFFYHPGLVDVHDLVEKILSLELDLTGLLYLDGGNHGSLFLAPELGKAINTWISLPNLLGIKSAP